MQRAKSISPLNPDMETLSRQHQDTAFTLLSTKRLPATHLEKLCDAHIAVTQYDAIGITMPPIPPIEVKNSVILTSKNAYRSLSGQGLIERLQDKTWFVVGKTTVNALTDRNFKVEIVAENARELGERIVESYRHRSFTYFAGNRRRDELPSLLRSHHIDLEEIVVYHTLLRPKRFAECFNALLFLSPSGVESYLTLNTISQEMCFCIGSTTAEVVRYHTDRILIPTSPTLEALVDKVIEFAKEDDKK